MAENRYSSSKIVFERNGVNLAELPEDFDVEGYSKLNPSLSINHKYDAFMRYLLDNKTHLMKSSLHQTKNFSCKE